MSSHKGYTCRIDFGVWIVLVGWLSSKGLCCYLISCLSSFFQFFVDLFILGLFFSGQATVFYIMFFFFIVKVFFICSLSRLWLLLAFVRSFLCLHRQIRCLADCLSYHICYLSRNHYLLNFFYFFIAWV